MNLINDEYNNTWYWIMPEKPDYPMSPQFDEETDALLWRGQIAKENFYDWEGQRKELEALYIGDSVILPKSKEHAESMLRVAHFYLDTNK